MSATSPEIELYSYTISPYGQKVAAYLKYKRLDYRYIAVNPMTSAELSFSKQTQVPVVKIGGEWRKESSEIGLWLDELYPEKPLLPIIESEREKLLSLDRWISDSLYPAFFRPFVDWSYDPIRAIRNGWKMGRGLCDDGSAPYYLRWAYPVAVRRIPFIRHMLHRTDFTESFLDMVTRLESEFVEHLDTGPYLGGMDSPTLADFSAYPAIAQKYRMGVDEKRNYVDNPVIARWCNEVESHLEGNPFLMADHLVVRDVS